MYVPMARRPVWSRTVVATRIMSPRSFSRWKSVASAPTRSRTRSTSRVGRAGSTFCPAQRPPTRSFGRRTSVADPSSWFTACHATVSLESVAGPSRSSWSCATRRLRGTCCDSSRWVASQRVPRSRAARARFSSPSRAIPRSTRPPSRLRCAAKTRRNATASSSVGATATATIFLRSPARFVTVDTRRASYPEVAGATPARRARPCARLPRGGPPLPLSGPPPPGRLAPHLLVDPRDRAERRRLRLAARERFLRGGEPEGVGAPIARSWRRARDVYRIDPALREVPLLPDDELARRLEADETLEAAGPVLADFSARLRGRAHALAFLDGEGRMLTIGGDPGVTAEAVAAWFRPGAVWREDAAGTNGPGTALAERVPVEVFASEHYAEGWHAWACAAAPIVAAGSPDPAGVVGLVGPWDAPDPPGLLAATAIALAVQERLRAMASVREEVVRHALRAARAGGDPLLAVDARGRLLAANDAARRRLGLGAEVPPEVAARLAAALRAGPAEEFA